MDLVRKIAILAREKVARENTQINRVLPNGSWK
jgi:hypothetical protein